MTESKQNTASFMWQKHGEIKNLISDLNAKDFIADKVKFYEGVRQRLAAIYKEDLSIFGPEKTTSYPFLGRDDSLLSVDEQEKQKRLDQELIKRGYNCVLEKKLKTYTHMSNFSPYSYHRSKNWIKKDSDEELVKLWGGSPTSYSLTFGVSSNSVSSNIPNSNTSPINSCASSASCSSKSSPSPASENEVHHNSSSGYVPNSDAEDEEFLADNLSDLSDPLLTSTAKKRKAQEELP